MFAAFGFGGGGSTFSATYRVYPVSFLEKESAERGDKLILPPSALDRLGGNGVLKSRFSGYDDTPRSGPPTLGEHTDAVLAELGYSEGEIAALRTSKAVA